MKQLPTRLYRVSWQAAVGWPHPEQRQDTARNYTTPESAARQVASIRAMPSHLKLQGVHVSDEIEWSEFDPDDLPQPKEEGDENPA